MDAKGYEENSPSPEVVRAALERILSSDSFQRSDRLASFLRFVVEEALTGRAEGLKEYSVGVGVYQRPDFDPRLDSAVRVDARRLRQKLDEYYSGAGAAEQLRIELPKGSYVPLFTQRATQPPLAAESAPDAPKRLLPLYTSALLLLSVAAFWVWKSNPTERIQVLAVLPYSNLTSDSSLNGLGEGLAEELLHRAAGLPQVRVLARNVARDWDAAKQHGANAVLDGSIRSSGGRLRIATQLVRVADRATIWSESLDVDKGDALSIQARVGSLVEAKFRHAEASRNEPGPRSAELRAQLERVAFLAQRRARTGIEKAIAEAREVLKNNPDHAVAQALEADALLMLVDYLRGDEKWQGLERAKRAAERALDLDSAMAAPHATLGLMLARYEWKWSEGENLLRRALALEPGRAVALIRLARVLAAQGKMDEALRLALQAHMRAPTQAYVLSTYGQLAYYGRRYEDALRLLSEAQDLDPGYVGLNITKARALSYLGRHREARALVEALPAPTRQANEFRILESWLLAREGKPAAARRILESVTLASPISIAGSWAELGQFKAALAALRSGIKERDVAVEFLAVSPVIDALRNEPEITELLRQMNLAATPR